MNLKDRIILEDFRKNKDDFIVLGDIVQKMLSDIAKRTGAKIMAIEHRVKEESSLAGKLERKGDHYSVFEDITDILGARVICFFPDEVDILGKEIEKDFVIDWENSVDKRALIKADSFGYLSLHYICSLPEGGNYPERLTKWRFEIQLRTILQHTWSDINHDIGYKSEFGLPRSVIRGFSRVAGLLELADEEFMHLRDSMESYTNDIRVHIEENTADDLPLNSVSLGEYVKRNRKMREFLEKLAAFSNADIDEIDPSGYVEQLMWFGIKTIGGLQTMLSENENLALQLAERALNGSDLDILSSSVGLRYLCRAELLNKGYSVEQATEFLKISMGDEVRAGRQAKYLCESYRKMQENIL